MKKLSKGRGFSLIEIVIVMALVGGIIGFIAVYVNRSQDKLIVQDAKRQVLRVAEEVSYFRQNNSRYPSSLQELIAPNNGEPTLESKEIIDPWGRELIYTYPGVKNPTKFDVCSMGANGTECVYGNW